MYKEYFQMFTSKVNRHFILAKIKGVHYSANTCLCESIHDVTKMVGREIINPKTHGFLFLFLPSRQASIIYRVLNALIEKT